MSNITKSDIAYLKGRYAYRTGKPMSDNFYSWNARVAGLAGWWEKGWIDEQAQTELPAKPKPHGTECTAEASENSGFEQTDSEKLYYRICR